MQGINNGRRKKVFRLRLPRRRTQSYRNKAGFYLHKRTAGTDRKIKENGSAGRKDSKRIYFIAQQTRCRILPAELAAFRRRKNEKRTNIYKWRTDKKSNRNQPAATPEPMAENKR